MLIDLSKDYSSHNLLYSYFKKEIPKICPELEESEIEVIAKKFTYKYDTLMTEEMERQLEHRYMEN